MKIYVGKKFLLDFVYDMLKDFKLNVSIAWNKKENILSHLWRLLRKKIKIRLDCPLHLITYYLNPDYYRNNVVEVNVVRTAFMYCLDVFY